MGFRCCIAMGETDPSDTPSDLDNYKKAILDSVKSTISEELKSMKTEIAGLKKSVSEESRLVSKNCVKKLQS